MAFGIDIGGSGMKAAPVDLTTGTLTAERHKVLTPKPATPKAMAAVVRQLVDHFQWEGNVGVAFPAVVRNGVARSAANIDKSWIGTDIDAVFTSASGRPVHVINDADAAGLAEMRYGAGRGRDGVVIMLTFGTGIGSGLFHDGTLVPNTELGHLELDGHKAEHRAAAVVRDREKLSWKEWGRARRPLPRARRVPVLARSVDHRRRRQPQGRQVAAVRRRGRRDRRGGVGERGRHRRRGVGRRPGHDGLKPTALAAARAARMQAWRRQRRRAGAP